MSSQTPDPNYDELHAKLRQTEAKDGKLSAQQTTDVTRQSELARALAQGRPHEQVDPPEVVRMTLAGTIPEDLRRQLLLQRSSGRVEISGSPNAALANVDFKKSSTEFHEHGW